MVVFSKLHTIPTSCMEYVHPWTDSCSAATTCLAMHAVQDSLRIYVTVYMLALLMRGKVPTQKDIRRTIQGIIQSTAFLTCSAASFSLFACFLRRVLGNFNVLTVSYIPAFISSYVSIMVERPSRRGMLSLYVTNVASETLFRMAVWRGLVRPIRHGEVLIFMTAMSALLYFYKGRHISQDSIYSLLRFVVGPYEGKGFIEDHEKSLFRSHSETPAPVRSTRPYYLVISSLCSVFQRLQRLVRSLGKHPSCPHPYSCTHYTLQGTAKLFSVGFGLQVCLKLLLHMRQIVRNPRCIPKQFIHKDAFRFGAFLGGFSGIYRLMSCLLRRVSGRDSKLHAVPAGMLAGLSFAFFPFNTIALYVMWKSLQIVYNSGVEAGYFPELPGASILLYCLSTATLFHAALLEPQNLRPSYWKFLVSLSGGRIVAMDRLPLDAFGLETSKALAEVIVRTKTPVLPSSGF